MVPNDVLPEAWPQEIVGLDSCTRPTDAQHRIPWFTSGFE